MHNKKKNSWKWRLDKDINIRFVNMLIRFVGGKCTVGPKSNLFYTRQSKIPLLLHNKSLKIIK